jgi:hypothetical protein
VIVIVRITRHLLLLGMQELSLLVGGIAGGTGLAVLVFGGRVGGRRRRAVLVGTPVIASHRIKPDFAQTFRLIVVGRFVGRSTRHLRRTRVRHRGTSSGEGRPCGCCYAILARALLLYVSTRKAGWWVLGEGGLDVRQYY